MRNNPCVEAVLQELKRAGIADVTIAPNRPQCSGALAQQRRQRPQQRCQGYSITSLASNWMELGTAVPRALALCRLTAVVDISVP
jgi:hypothetical protein